MSADADERARIVDLARTAGRIEAVMVGVYDARQCVIVVPEARTDPGWLGRYISAAHPAAIMRLLETQTPPTRPEFDAIRAQLATCRKHGLKSATVDVDRLAALLDLVDQ